MDDHCFGVAVYHPSELISILSLCFHLLLDVSTGARAGSRVHERGTDTVASLLQRGISFPR